MTRTAYVQCSAGVAGDMLLGALVDAGADPDVVAAGVAGLGVDGYALTFERVRRAGLAATWANVVTDDAGPDHDHPHRPITVIRQLLAAADLPDRVRQRAAAVFEALAEAEGAVHGIAPDDVELHEVGALDAIVDVVGVAAALESLGVERIVAGPIATGRGAIRAAHGELPNPPPAVARLLAGRAMPAFGIDTDLELATPTGVAVLAALAAGFGAMPAMTVTAVGYGAGRADPPGRPNVVQVLLGDEPAPAAVTDQPGERAAVVEVNVDDVTGEVLAHAISRLLEAGAFDAWATPIVMKKGRPAHTVSALCDPAVVSAVATVMLAETGSLGVRASTVERWPQARRDATVDIDGHSVRLKVAGHRVKVEHDDAAAAAAALGRPLRDVLAEAEQRWREIGSGPAGAGS